MSTVAALRATAEVRREAAAEHYQTCRVCLADEHCPTYDVLSGLEADAEDAAWR